MTFLTGTLLLGTLAAAIPVLIHLLHRQRTVPVRWGAMQFLLESQLQFRRRKKVDNWLLLLARMALLALLAFLLARPLMIEGKYNPLSAAGSTDIAVVIDRSLSTGRKAAATEAGGAGGTQSVFERGVSVADEISRIMRPGDTLSVVLAEHRPDPSLTPLPVRSGNVKEAHDKLRKLPPGSTFATVPDAVQAAREQMARGPNAHKVIVVVSDEQRNAWQIDNAAAWSGALGDRAAAGRARVYALPVSAEPRAGDVAVGDLTVEPTLVGLKRPAQITATLANTGANDAGPLTATLVVGGNEAGKQSVTGLKPGESRTVRFDHTFAAAGSNWVQVRADVDDALDADDVAVGAVNVLQRLPVLVIDGQLTTAGNFRSSQFLVAAMQPVADVAQEATTLIQPRVISAGAAEGEKFEDYALVVVNDVPQLAGGAVERLGAYARAGHGVWVILGPRTDASFVEKQLNQAGLLNAAASQRSAAATPPGVELKAAGNPMVALLAAAERNAMTGAVTRQWWSLTPRDGDEQVVLASAGTGEPLVLERPVGRNGGRLVVWCSSADGAWNNWPLMPNFVPLVNETVHHLAGASVKSSGGRRLEAGMPLEWTGPAEPRIRSASVTRPDGKTVQKQPTVTGGRQRLSYNDTAAPGLYTLRFDNTSVPQPVYFGVGLDRRELDQATLTEADHAWLTSRGFVEKRITPAELSSALGGVNQGAELWKWLALGVLALLVFETLMTRRMARLQAAPDAAPLVHSPGGGGGRL
jgi:hypothetical protein